MKNIVVFDEVKTYRRVYEGFSTSEAFEQYTNEAQLLDIKQWLGDSFLLSLANSRARGTLTQFEKDALFGCEYSHEGRPYFHEGIKAALAYYAYARFLDSGGTVSTQFGLVTKLDDYSKPAEPAEIARQRKSAITAAEAFKLDTNSFLTRNAVNYPLFNIIVGRRTAARKSHITIVGQ